MDSEASRRMDQNTRLYGGGAVLAVGLAIMAATGSISIGGVLLFVLGVVLILSALLAK